MLSLCVTQSCFYKQYFACLQWSMLIVWEEILKLSHNPKKVRLLWAVSISCEKTSAVFSTHHLPPSGLWPRRWRQASPSNPSISARSRCTSVTSWASPPSQLSAIPSKWSTYSTTFTHSSMLSLDCMMSTRWVLGDPTYGIMMNTSIFQIDGIFKWFAVF